MKEDPIGRTPWWVALAGVGYVLFLGVMAWCGLWGPEDPGLIVSFQDGSLRVSQVDPRSPAASALLQPGDRLTAADGRDFRSRFDWMIAVANWEPGKPVLLRAVRGAATREVQLDLKPRSWRRVDPGTLLAALGMWLVRVLTLAAACLILIRGKDFIIARLGAWFLASCSVASVVLLPGMAYAWRVIPPLAAVFMWFPVLSALSLPAIFFTFYVRFPGTLRVRSWAWIAMWLPQLAVAAVMARYLLAVVYWPALAAGTLPDWFAYAFAFVACSYLVAGILVELWKRRHLPGANDRRCAGLLAAGAAMGWCASVPIVLLDWYGRGSTVSPALFASPAAIFSMALFLACLGLLSYILLRKQVFGFEVIVRLGLRYALARRVLVSLVPACGLFLLADLLLHGDQPLLTLFRQRGWIYALLAALAFLAQARREQWLHALDRRFFRERYQAQQLLREVAEFARQSGDFDNVAPKVVAQIASALHAEWVALMAKDPGRADYHCVAAEPAERAPASIAGDSKLISFLRVLGKPIEMSISSEWLREQLPSPDTEFVREARIELLVPIPSSPGGREALLAAGPKRSEEPYAGEDQDLLTAIAANLALLLVRPASRQASTTSHIFHECPRCGLCFDDNVRLCNKDSEPLVPRSLPRFLSGRYRLDSRLGAGGMGTVYEALDLELERRVAVKVLHESLIGDLDAAARFRREAKAAAAFSHPNIVTVFDFGIVASTRAFLVMELMSGETLRERIRAQRRLPAAEVRAILHGVCDAVDTAHRRQMIHRDLKPENIFLARADHHETPKVLDFGIVKLLETNPLLQSIDNTQSGVVVGTFRYMSPEQLRGGTPTPHWDTWALAVIAYEMLIGCHPFEESTPAQWFAAARRSGNAELPTLSLSEVPFHLEEFFAAALASNPARRPATASELLAALEAALLPSETSL